MKRIGITGGIGSGKTTVCKIFESLGIPVYYADDRAKVLMTENKKLVDEIKKLIGDKSYFEDGSLNRQYIASVVFKNKNKLEQLNSLVHPAVAKDGILWQQSQSVVPYTLKEAALLIESGSFQALDYLITVWAPKETRIQRVIKRDNITRHEVEARIDKQIPEFEKLRLAQFVIINDGKKSLVQQVQKLHQRFK
ncbi:MAG: dephospho-CoA kinase [Saprospiraceae bacterium]|jgi:dephospho-CoA kinase|nr:dephospho-CoA kinase [Saprospiraceae bacterium]MDC3253718.1 dephospho-CoA kinase [bacterium]MDG1436143.1 dephospho-CoA kinase [Saprospiraceae bacterium]MDG2419481.1 dephospho-CoA kinase [Saprospiraceae bacterium]